MFRQLVRMLVFVLVMLLSFPGHSLCQEQHLRIATATPGGVYHPVGIGIASLISIKLSRELGIIATAESSSGSVENIRLLASGGADLAIVQALAGLDAHEGRAPFDEGPVEGVLAIASLWDNVEHFVLCRELVHSGDVTDLSGLEEPFSMGSEGSGTEHSGDVLLRTLGIVPGTAFAVSHRDSYKAAAQAVIDRKDAGAYLPGGVPLGAVVKLFASLGPDTPVILAITEEQAQKINEAHPVWNPHIIPAGTYPGQAEDILTMAQPNFLACRADLPEETVYAVTRTIFENLPFLHSIHQATQGMSLENGLTGLPLELHPGAARYFREQGMLD